MHGDWLKENVYLEVLRDALKNKRLPYEYVTSLHTDFSQFLAIPEICLFPDILLLPYLTNNDFFFLHTAIFYSLGVIGIFLFARRWSTAAQICVFLLFNFNGFILNHLAEGHFQFIGYFLFPLCLWLIDQLLKNNKSIPKSHLSIYLGLLIGFSFLNGSTHTAVWVCILIGLVMLLALGTNSLYLALSLIVAALVGAARLLPSSLYFYPISDFITGYPSIQVFVESFLISHGPRYAVEINNDLKIGWWEFDNYLGYTATLLMIYMLIRAYKNSRPLFSNLIVLAALCLIIFSLGDTWKFITYIPLPIAKVERISSRFIALAVVVFLLVAMQEFNKSKLIKSKVAYLLLLVMGFEIALNSTHYFTNTTIISARSLDVVYLPPQLSAKNYIDTVNTSIFVSLTAIFGSLIALLYKPPPKKSI